jgi:hypothetical protein
VYGLDNIDRATLREVFNDHHANNSVVVTLRQTAITGRSVGHGKPTYGATTETELHAQVTDAADQRNRTVFGDELTYNLVVELSVDELDDLGLTIDPTDRDVENIFVLFDRRYRIVSGANYYEQLGEHHAGLRFALREDES